MEHERHNHDHDDVGGMGGGGEAETKYVDGDLAGRLHCGSGPVLLQGGGVPPYFRQLCRPADVTYPEETPWVLYPPLYGRHRFLCWCR